MSKSMKEIFEGIEITEEQEKAFLECIEEYSSKKLAALTEEFEKFKVHAEKAFALIESDGAAALKQYEDKARKAFALFESEAEKKKVEALTEMKREFAENMVTALQEMYSESYAKARADLLATPEFALVEEFRKRMTITASSDEYKAALEEIDRLKNKERAIEEANAQLERDKLIASLCEDIPAKFQPRVRDFISKAKTNDEVYQYFKAIADVIVVEEQTPPAPAPQAAAEESAEQKIDAPVSESVEASVKVAQQPRFRKKNSKPSEVAAKSTEKQPEAEPVFESETQPTPQISSETKAKFSKGFTAFEQQVLTQVFGKKSFLNK